MIVTYLRSGDASERELEALAIYMGHSIQMQRDSYDRRTKAQKVEPAVELLQLVNTNAAAASRGAQGTAADANATAVSAASMGATGAMVNAGAATARTKGGQGAAAPPGGLVLSVKSVGEAVGAAAEGRPSGRRIAAEAQGPGAKPRRKRTPGMPSSK